MSDLETHVCAVCGITYAAPGVWWKERRNDLKTFYCPNGHGRVFSQSESDKLRQERDQLKQNAAYLEDRIRREREAREAAERSAAATRGVVTRLKNRAANGVCPCCNRTFANLARHMATKHQGFAAEEVPEGASVQ